MIFIGKRYFASFRNVSRLLKFDAEKVLYLLYEVAPAPKAVFAFGNLITQVSEHFGGPSFT